MDSELAGGLKDDLLFLVPAPTHTLSVLGKRALEERRRRLSVSLAAAESLTGLGREEIEENIAQSPQAVSLVIRVLAAVGNSGNDWILRILGSCIGRASVAHDALGEEEAIVRAVDDLTTDHLEVLAVSDIDGQTTEAVEKRAEGRLTLYRVPVALAMLNARGFFANPYGGFGGGETWTLSELGRAVRNAALAAHPQRVESDD